MFLHRTIIRNSELINQNVTKFISQSFGVNNMVNAKSGVNLEEHRSSQRLRVDHAVAPAVLGEAQRAAERRRGPAAASAGVRASPAAVARLRSDLKKRIEKRIAYSVSEISENNFVTLCNKFCTSPYCIV